MTISMLGWVATSVFAASYFFREASALKRIQAVAACLWIIYGVAIGALPVVVANVIVAGAAIYSSLWPHRALSGEPTKRIQEANLPVVRRSVADERESGIA
jgi:hypothetical protein